MTDHLASAQQDLDVALHAIASAQHHLEQLAPADGVITDREPRPLPPLPPLPVGQVITDPTFGARIARLTGPGTGASGTAVSFRSSDNTTQRSWNAAMTHFTIEDTYGQQLVWSFEAKKLRAKFRRALPFSVRPRTTPPPLTVPFNGSDSSWHDTDPDRIYGRWGNKVIKVYNVRDESFDVVCDLDTLGLNLPAESYTGTVQVMAETLLTTCGGAVNDDHHHIVILALATNAVQATLDTLTLTQFNAGQGFTIHGAVLEITGRYVILVPAVKSGDTTHLYVWDLREQTVVPVTTAISGHLAVGRAHWVNQDCAPGSPWDAAQWVWRAFDTPDTVHNVIAPVLEPQEIYLAEHPSWTNMQALDTPFVTATYRHQPSSVPWRAWDEEIVTIGPTSGVVRRQAHHRSQVLKADQSFDYWATPRPNISPDGRFALFTSNWGRTLGTDAVEGGDRQDAFVVELR